MWDMTGLECIFNVTEHLKDVEDHEKKVMWDILKDSNFKEIGPPKIPLQSMILRARFNSQRCYEIYEFNSTLEKDELAEVFKENPQPIVNWIRKNGHKIYSDHVKHDKKIIT